MATKDRKAQVLIAIMAVLLGFVAVGIVGRVVALVPAGGAILATLLVAAIAVVVVGRRSPAAKPWMRRMSDLVFRYAKASGFVAVVLVLACLLSISLRLQASAQAEIARAAEERRRAVAEAQAIAEREKDEAAAAAGAKLVDSFKRDKNGLFGRLEEARQTISAGDLTKSTELLDALRDETARYDASPVAELLEFQSLRRGVDALGKDLEAAAERERRERADAQRKVDDAESARRAALVEKCGEASGWYALWPMASVYTALTMGLRDPDSLELDKCGDPVLDEKKCWILTCDWRAKNAFGALVLHRVRYFIKQGTPYRHEVLM